jgi:hypothetical protein
MKKRHALIGLLALTAAGAAGTAQATAISQSTITLDLDSFVINPGDGAYTTTGYATGGNVNAESDPLAGNDKEIYFGPNSSSSTEGWTEIAPAQTNSATNANSSASSNANSIDNTALAKADGVINRLASAAAVVYHNVDFDVTQAGTFTFSIAYTINQSLERDANDETANANSQVSFEIRQSGKDNPLGEHKDEVKNRLQLNELLGGTMNEITDTLVYEFALEAGNGYSIGIQAYTQAFADTPNFTPMVAPGSLALLFPGLLMLAGRRRATR